MDALEVQDGEPTPSLPLDKLAAIYIRIRDAKDDLTETYKTKVADLDEQMGVLETQMLNT